MIYITEKYYEIDKKDFQKYIRYLILAFFLILFTIFSLRHFILGGDVAASVDALCPFGGFETLYTFISSGGFVPRIMISSLILAIGIILTTLIFKRGFCGYICPFGTVQELLSKIKKVKPKISLKIDKMSRNLKYIILITIILGTAITGTLVYRNYDPFVTFFHFGKGILWEYDPAEISDHITGFIITIIVLIASVFVSRFFCRFLCPLGGIMKIFSKIGLSKIIRDKDSCIDCKICDNICPMNVKISDKHDIKDHECINCNNCITKCPKDALSIKIFNKNMPVLSYAISLIILFFVVIGTSKAIGVWQSVPTTNLQDSSGTIDPELIKGWMTLDEVAYESGINVMHFIIDLDLPKNINTSTRLKDISNNYNINFETEDLREYVRTFKHGDHHVETVKEQDTKETDCPWNIIDDPAPGECGLYIDKDSNDICDYSE